MFPMHTSVRVSCVFGFESNLSENQTDGAFVLLVREYTRRFSVIAERTTAEKWYIR